MSVSDEVVEETENREQRTGNREQKPGIGTGNWELRSAGISWQVGVHS
jgi:hypothetical protein